MSTATDIENLRAIFAQIMKKHQLRPENVRRESSWIAFSDLGEFLCDNESHRTYKWRSKFSWVTFDLINLEVVYRWKMKCKNCFETSEPTFAVSQLEEMFEIVVSYYKGHYPSPSIDIGYNGRRNFFRRDPHIPELCEKCKYGEDRCWFQKFYTIPRPRLSKQKVLEFPDEKKTGTAQ